MKILGKTSIKQRSLTVPVGQDEDGNPVELIMRPVKYGELMELEATMPEPTAPSTGIKRKDKNGQALKRNGQFLYLRDEADPDHIDRMTRRNVAVKCATVILSLGDQIADLPQKPESQDAVTYWLSVLDDLTDFGIDTGVFQDLSKAAEFLSQPLNEWELRLIRNALGTEKETPETTEEKEQEAADAATKAAEEGKLQGVGAHPSTTNS